MNDLAAEYHPMGGRNFAMEKDELPIAVGIWLLLCLALVASKAAGQVDISWGIATAPFWAPILLGTVFYFILGE